ncbi:MAG: acetamidase/formamidase family protein [Planctomycetes bacterium]|nr:acetamidase/formamidase family protein [Planctomycetota bacterium]
MQRILRENTTAFFSGHVDPVITVSPGETFLIETEDSRGGRTRQPDQCTPESLRSMRQQGYVSNPVMGPIFVEGAQPGDTLAVEIHEMKCDSQGYYGYWPFEQNLQDIIEEPVTRLVKIIENNVVYSFQAGGKTHELRLPVSPVIGTIGTAPREEVVYTYHTGTHGGNLDVPEIGPGCTIYLPVAVEGAYLALGDCHARQGDGELSAIEMRSEVTLSVRVLKNWTQQQTWLRAETEDELLTIACDRPLESAQWLAIREMISWLEERQGWTKSEAREFLSIASDVKPGQSLAGPYSMRVLVPKKLLP